MKRRDFLHAGSAAALAALFDHSGIPRWEPWNPTQWPTMVFNTNVQAVNDPWGAERRAIGEWRARS